ncbi:MAG: LacI family DNA-binding transcriptional regulator [Silicimonas sp.]|nr:LacI family DNA-binding transcriptional regulator [Silicimonas sp.]
MIAVVSAPTLEDVAKRAGVSTATVSRCLNSPDKVVAKTREKVMKTVRELGYAPNFSARALAARRTQTIGAVIPTMENAIFAQGLQAFQERLGEDGFMLLVASSSYDRDIEEAQIRALVARGADGILLIGHDRDPAVYQFLRTQNVPVLIAWAYSPERLSIGFDNRAAMEALASHAIELGHSRIGVITAPTEGNDRARGRIEGIRAAVSAAGMNPEDLAIEETEYSVLNGADAFDRLMVVARPSLVICGNDVLAAGALRRAGERGLSVPGEVSITGFDDIELARLVTPKLTTVRVPHRQMGEAAAEMLIGMTRGETPQEGRCLPTWTRFGGTLAAPMVPRRKGR